MRLGGRVRALERRRDSHTQGASCRAYGGAGAPGGVLVVEGEAVGGPPTGCPACGRVGALHRMVVAVDRGEPTPGREAQR